MRSHVAAALASRFPTVLWLGDELRLVYNDAYIPALGDKHPAALGRPGAEVWWDIWDVVGPMLTSVMASGKATWDSDLRLMLVNDGRKRERFFTFTYSPILGADGRVEGVFCAVAETTERVIGERRLQALNALAAALLDVKSADAALEASIEVCAAHDADLPFAAIYLTGGGPAGTQAHLATPRVAGILPASLAPLLEGASLSADGTYLVGGLPSRIPGLADRFGDQCPEQALVVPVSAAVGERPGAVLVLGFSRFDLLDDLYRGFCRLLGDQVSAALAGARAYEDERSRAEALADLDRAKTTFLTNVSHEFRTPLTLMLGPLDDLISAVRDTGEGSAGEGTAERLEMIRRNGRRLLRLVNSLLEFSRVEAGQASPQPRATDLGALTAGVASAVADVCRLAGICLVIECPPAWAEVDPGMWETIVLNLVSNAIKHTFSGSVTVRVSPAAGGGIDMTVTDTGTGIAADALPHLFDRFYRAASSAGRSAEGSGIGLAVVKSLVDLHGGAVAIESTLAAGTTVTVRLPAAAVADPVPAAGGPPPASSWALDAYVDEAMQWAGPQPEGRRAEAGEPGRALVLVADDNADMRAHLARVLGTRWAVMTAPDGRQALALARHYRPDLMVADVMMPALDGFGLVAAIRADQVLAPLPVIMLSARAGVEAAGEGLSAGADDYLVKPFSSADLVNRVAARLEAAARDQAWRADPLAQRDQALTSLGSALADARSVEQALAALLGSPLCCLEATSAIAAVLDEPAGLLRVTHSGEISPEASDQYRLVELAAAVPIAEVVRGDEPMVIPDIARLGPRYGQVAADAATVAQASIIHPLHGSDGGVTGAVALAWSQPRRFSRDDVEVSARVAAMMARALNRIAAAERGHQIAMALQERLLDLGVGARSAVVAAAYQPSGEAMRVGGDWYTATAIDATRMGVSVGDVAGHGLPAAAVMSQLRSALATAALAEADPAAVLGLLDRYARTIPGAMFATAAYAIIDTDAGTVDYTCAGHPYPLIVSGDGEARYLEEGRRTPLGAKSAAIQPATGHARLPAGSLLLLYTDGLIERRKEPLDVGMSRLAAAATECARLPAGAVCSALLQAMADTGGYADDVAMVAVRPCGTTPTSHVDALPAAFTEMAAARERLRRWLEHAVPDPAAAAKILLATGEALANAIEHGSDRDPDRTVTIEAFAAAGVTVTIGDTGHWTEDTTASPGAARGRGLALVNGLADHVQTTRTQLGTRLTISWDLAAQPGLARVRP